MKNLEENFQYDSQNRVFPATAQSVTYTGFDKADKVKQGNDSLCYTYGYDHQRISMKEELGGNIRIKDNLGSWTTITDANGNVEQRLSYDAWGNLRDPNTWSGGFSDTPMFDRGFIGHEHLLEQSSARSAMPLPK